MTRIDLSTAEFVVDLLRKVEELGDAVTDEESMHISRIEIAEGDEVVGYIVNDAGSWAFETGDEDGSEDEEAGGAPSDGGGDEGDDEPSESEGTSGEGSGDAGSAQASGEGASSSEDPEEDDEEEPTSGSSGGASGGQPSQGGQGDFS